MKTLSIDIETYSDVPLQKSGVYRYCESPNFEILLFGYSADSGPVQVVDLACGEKIPADVLDALTDDAVTKWAFNASFERVCLSRYLRDLGISLDPFHDKHPLSQEVARFLNPESWRCSMVWAATMGLPLSLEGVGAVLGLEKQKLTEGKELIKFFCQPCAPTKTNGQRTRNRPFHAPDKWDAFKRYNLRDVETEMGIQKRLNGMNDEQKETVVKIAAVVAAIGPMLILFGKITSTVGTAMKGFSGLTKGIAKLGVKIAGSSGSITGLGSALGAVAGPVLAVVAVIGTLAAAFATLWKTNDEFRENIIGTWNQIKETVSGFCQGIVDRLNSLGFEFESITEVMSAVWQGFCNLLAPVFEGVFNYIANTLSTVLDVILGIVDVFISVFQGDWSGAWEAVKGIFTTMWEGLVSWFENILGTLKGVADVVLGWFGTSWDEVWNAVSTTFTNIWNGITTFFSDAWETIKNVVSVGIQFIGSLLEAAWDIITLPFQLIWENCGDTITSIWETIKTTVGNAINAVSTTLSSVMNVIQTTISTIWTAISTKISTVVNSIKTTVSTVFNAIKTTATTIWNGIKTSISTVVDGVKTKVTTVFNSVKSTLSSVFSSIKSTATSVWNGIKSAITGPIDQAKTHISNALNSIKNFFANCKLSLPHIKMPHFSISGSFSLNPPSVPHLSVSWYKEGGIMTDPTLFGFNGSSLMAGGEAGPEAILPLKGFYTKLEAMLDSKLNMSGMEKYLEVIAQNSEKGIYLDGSTLVGKLAPGMNRQLGILAAQEVYR